MKPRSKREMHRSRLRLLLAFGLIILGQLVGGYFIDFHYPLLRFPSLRFVYQELFCRSTSPDIVFLGSSRFGGDIQEKEINTLLEKECHLDRRIHVLNAAVPGGDHASQRYVLEQLLYTGVRPQLVVLEVSPEFLNWYNPFYEFSVIRQFGWSDLMLHAQPAADASQMGRFLTTRFLPLYQHRSEIWKVASEFITQGHVSMHLKPPQRTFEEPTRCDLSEESIDWEKMLRVQPPKQAPEIADLITQGAQLVSRSWLRHYRLGAAARHELRRTLDICRREGIRVVLLSPPVTTAHREAHIPPIWIAFRGLLDDLCKEYGCRYYDGRAWLPDSMFYDTHHVEGEGGILFSRLLTRKVLAPWWKQVVLGRKWSLKDELRSDRP